MLHILEIQSSVRWFKVRQTAMFCFSLKNIARKDFFLFNKFLNAAYFYVLSVVEYRSSDSYVF